MTSCNSMVCSAGSGCLQLPIFSTILITKFSHAWLGHHHDDHAVLFILRSCRTSILLSAVIVSYLNNFMRLVSMFILKPYVGSDLLVSGFSAALVDSDNSIVLAENIVTNASCLWAR
ncbi:hypothetical protein P692DRAFT_20574154 [Suillus brevipes Sb2]|nr:hypothetical protein P692DRAFT_20574154 [Suillus brevipes Sb2]